MGRPKHRKIYILLVILFFMAGVLLGIRYFQSKESVEIRKKDAASHIKKEHPMKIPKETEKAQRESEKVQEQESMETEEKAEVNITETQAGDVVEDSVLAQKGMEQFFYKEELSDEVFARMDGVSYPQNAQIGREELCYLRVLHTGFDEKTYIGELVVNQKIADDVLEIMKELYENHYPIEKMRLIDEYGADDEASMSDNNTSAFNYRTIAGTNRLSKHGQGLAVDINPRYNPCVRTKNGITTVEPQNGSAYVDRNADFSYKITEGDLCLQLFLEHGFTWGGSWNSVKDYQHFEKAVE
jgi:hypothetical protein